MFKFIVLICLVLITVKLCCADSVKPVSPVTMSISQDTLKTESMKTWTHFVNAIKSIHINIDKAQVKSILRSVKTKTINGIKSIKNKIHIDSTNTTNNKTLSILIK